MEFGSVNWIAVVTGSVAAFLFGWLWYSPLLFFKPWAAGSCVEATPAGSPPMIAMVLQILGLLFLASVIGVTAAADALFTAILAILATAALSLSGGAFSGKNGAALAIDGGYIIGAGILMISAQAIF